MTMTATRRDVLRGAAVAAGGLALEACAGSGMANGRAAGAPSASRTFLPGGLEVRGPKFYKDGKPFYVSGFNYWPATTLSREGNAAGWDQVRRDLDALQAIGINMIRTMGATEGPDSEPLRIVPTLQPAMGVYDGPGIAGLVKLADELQRRDLYGIFMLN